MSQIYGGEAVLMTAGPDGALRGGSDCEQLKVQTEKEKWENFKAALNNKWLETLATGVHKAIIVWYGGRE